MGYFAHHTIICTSWDDPGIETAHKEATRIFPWVSPISPPAVNGYRSFFIPPDGSKEGWAESDAGDKRRAEFVSWLRTAWDRATTGGTGYGFVEWAEVRFGGDDPDMARVVNRRGEDEETR